MGTQPVDEEAVAVQKAAGDCFSGPPSRLVELAELAELLVDTVVAADWAMFAKNGTDATTLCLTIARAATGRRTVLVAAGSYHGSTPWCTPNPTGTAPGARADLDYFTYNDLASVEQAARAADGDLAATMVTPSRHDAHRDQELVDPEFARGVRTVCDRTGAALILDDVRCGFRLDLRGSWEPFGVRPDLSAWSKTIANGYALAAVTGTDALRDAASGIYATGSFWCSAVSMAAALATITELRKIDGPALIHTFGTHLREGIAEQATAHGVRVNQTGSAQLPFLTFADDPDLAVAYRRTNECLRRGLIVHPWHNWFLSTAAVSRRELTAIPGAFTLGRMGTPVMIVALVWLAAVITVLVLPAEFRPAVYVVAGWMALATVWYLLVLRRRFRDGTAAVGMFARSPAGPASPEPVTRVE